MASGAPKHELLIWLCAECVHHLGHTQQKEDAAEAFELAAGHRLARQGLQHYCFDLFMPPDGSCILL